MVNTESRTKGALRIQSASPTQKRFDPGLVLVDFHSPGNPERPIHFSPVATDFIAQMNNRVISKELNHRKLNQNFSNAAIVVNYMFCPRCGKAEQLPETYCRQCGLLLPDLSKPVKRELAPEEHLKANTVLSVLTIITSFTLSILLWVFFGPHPGTHPLIYVTAGLLIGIGAWHIQTLIRTQKLKKQWKRRASLTESEAALRETRLEFEAASTGKLLEQADFSDITPASVTEKTTRHLAERRNLS